MMKKALILIDIQNDFISGSLAVPDTEAIVEPINEFMDDFGTVVATQDWHPAEHYSFYISHAGMHPFEVLEHESEQQTLWPPHCVQGSEGAYFCPALNTKPVAAIFRKGMDPAIDSYSAFFDNRGLRATGLDGYLRGLNVDTLYIAGLAADYCVYYSIKDALDPGYRVRLCERLTRAILAEIFEQQKQELAAYTAFELIP